MSLQHMLQQKCDELKKSFHTLKQTNFHKMKQGKLTSLSRKQKDCSLKEASLAKYKHSITCNIMCTFIHHLLWYYNRSNSLIQEWWTRQGYGDKDHVGYSLAIYNKWMNKNDRTYNLATEQKHWFVLFFSFFFRQKHMNFNVFSYLYI